MSGIEIQVKNYNASVNFDYIKLRLFDLLYIMTKESVQLFVFLLKFLILSHPKLKFCVFAQLIHSFISESVPIVNVKRFGRFIGLAQVVP